MTREEFTKQLDKKRYSYEIEGDKIIIISGYGGDVYLNALTSLPPGVVFNNKGNVYLNSLTSLPPGVVFNNKGGVYLEFLIGVWLYEWEGNIKGIDEKRLLNKMISIGLFDRR